MMVNVSNSEPGCREVGNEWVPGRVWEMVMIMTMTKMKKVMIM